MAEDKNTIDTHIGQKIRLQRTTNGLTQSDLGKAVGVTFQQIQKYEHGLNGISSRRLYKISRVLKVPISFFFDDLPKELDHELTFKPDDIHLKSFEFQIDSTETFSLIKNYCGITDIKVRKDIYNLLKSINDICSPEIE